MAKFSQVIKFEQNLDGITAEQKDVLFVRVSDKITSKDARFEVPVTHYAYLIKSGGSMISYKSGSYPVFENGKEAKAWKNGESVDVIYIPKDLDIKIQWGTPEKFTYRDPASGKVMQIGANGQFRIEIANQEQFFRKVVGSARKFDPRDFQREFGMDVINEFRDAFLKVVHEEELTYDQFDIKLKEIGSKIGVILNQSFEKNRGIKLVDFVIRQIVVDDADKQAIEESAAEKSKQEKLKEHYKNIERLSDKEWERDKYLKQLELQDRQAYYEVMKVIGKPNTSAPEEKPQKLICPGCNSEYKPGDKFCPRCGKKLTKEPIICPECGKTNVFDAAFCSNCGKKLQK